MKVSISYYGYLNGILLACLIGLVACQQSNAETSDGVSSSFLTKDTVSVKGTVIRTRSFVREVNTNGKIESRYKARVDFKIGGQLEKVNIAIGQVVKKGQVLAQIQNFELKNKLKKLDNQIDKAQVDLEAMLIGLGYEIADTQAIPPKVLRTALLESNLPGLKIDRELIQYQLDQSTIKAPIDGVIADVPAQAGNPSSNFSHLCTIIDHRQLRVIFPILESEIPFISSGQKVDIIPILAQRKSYQGEITRIKPMVNPDGTIQIMANIISKQNDLMDGMNVQVRVNKEVPKQLIVSKSAVLDRQGKLVVFTYKEGKAIWNYVNIALENNEAYAIQDGITAGDTVILDNNFNLSHLETVKLSELIE